MKWTRLCEKVGVEVKESGIEHHNTLGSGERYHDPLRRVFKKIMHESPKLDRHVALKLAVKAINDTMGPEGLVPSFIVFGCIPRFSTINSDLPGQKERIRALHQARKEISTITAEIRIKRALISKIPRNTDVVLIPGDKVRVFRETDRKCVVPFPVIRIEGMQVFVLQKDVENSIVYIRSCVRTSMNAS